MDISYVECASSRGCLLTYQQRGKVLHPPPCLYYIYKHYGDYIHYNLDVISHNMM